MKQSNLNLCSQTVATHIWLQNQLSLIPFEVRVVVLCQQIIGLIVDRHMLLSKKKKKKTLLGETEAQDLPHREGTQETHEEK